METISSLTSLIPVQYVPYLALLPLIGRIYYALKNGGGIVGVWRGVMFGTNSPK